MKQNVAPRELDPVTPSVSAAEAGTHSAGTGRDGESDAAGDESDSESSLVSAIGHLTRIGGELHTLLALRAERRVLKMRRWIAAGILAALGTLALVPLVLAGLYLFVAGTVQGFTELFGGRIWLANLTAGTMILGGLATLGYAAWTYVSRREQARMVAEYGDIPDETEPSEGPKDAEPSPPTAN